jgi:hypothetical protein
MLMAARREIMVGNDETSVWVVVRWVLTNSNCTTGDGIGFLRSRSASESCARASSAAAGRSASSGNAFDASGAASSGQAYARRSA